MSILSKEEVFQNTFDKADPKEEISKIHLNAMDLYAEQQAVEFEEWRIKKEYYYSRSSGGYFDKYGESICETTKELYKLFIKTI